MVHIKKKILKKKNKVYNLVVLSTFTKPCSHHQCYFQSVFIIPKETLHPLAASPHFLSPQPLAAPHLL